MDHSAIDHNWEPLFVSTPATNGVAGWQSKTGRYWLAWVGVGMAASGAKAAGPIELGLTMVQPASGRDHQVVPQHQISLLASDERDGGVGTDISRQLAVPLFDGALPEDFR